MEVTSRKNRALLAILALSPSLSTTRERLVGLLWSDRGEDQARASLRQSLAALRKELGEGAAALRTRDDIVSLDPVMLAIDVLDLRASALETDLGSLRAAASLYRGPLLADITLHDRAFEEWLAAERAGLVALAIRVLDRLVPLESGLAQVELARQLVSLDNLREASHRMLMRAYAMQGDKALSLRHYDFLERLLRDELGVDPAPETQSLRLELAANQSLLPTGLPAPVGKIENEAPEARPTIAVLPFAVMGGTSEQQYLGDGITEDIVISLSRFRTLATIAASSSFRFRDISGDLQGIAEALGASHILKGSVRLAADVIVITVQLLEAKSSRALWAERYEERLGDLPKLQNRLVTAVGGIIEGRIAEAGSDLVKIKPLGSWSAHDYFLKGRDLVRRYADAEALPYLEKAAELNPENAETHAWMAFALVGAFYREQDERSLDRALVVAQSALRLDEHNARVHHAAAYVRRWRRDFDEAEYHFERAMSLNPGDASIVYDYAHFLTYLGRPGECLTTLDLMRERDPFPPSWVYFCRSFALFQMARYEEALVELNQAPVEEYWNHAFKASALAHLGRLSEARKAIERLLFLKPGIRLKFAMIAMRGCKDPEQGRAYMEGLRLAGLPE